MTNATLVNALVKLRHRIDGQDVTLTQAEAQALYVGVLRYASHEHLADQEYAEQVQPRADIEAAKAGHPYGVAVREADPAWLAYERNRAIDAGLAAGRSEPE